jgi:uncharacterized membrane protein (UPF0182 family)
MEYKEGDFSFVEDKLHRYMLNDVYTSLNKTELWELVKENISLENPEVLQLFLAMKYKSHTMQTVGVVMRNMKRISIVGWDAYVKEWLETKKA